VKPPEAEVFWLVALSITAGMVVFGIEARFPRVFRALQRLIEFAFSNRKVDL
jgi:hypothetical protein